MENWVEFSKILSSCQQIEGFLRFLAVEFFRKRTKKPAYAVIQDFKKYIRMPLNSFETEGITKQWDERPLAQYNIHTALISWWQDLLSQIFFLFL